MKEDSKQKAMDTLLIMFTTDGLRLYEFNGKHPSMVGFTMGDEDITLNLDSEDLNESANLWRVMLELRELCPDKHVIMPYDTNVVRIEKAGELARKAYGRIMNPYFSSEDTELSPKKLDQIKAEVKAKAIARTETPVIPLLIVPTAQNQIKMKKVNQNQKQVKEQSQFTTGQKARGIALVASRAGFGTAHFFVDSFAEITKGALIGGETLVEQALLGTNRTFMEAFKEVKDAREATTRAYQQKVIDQAKKAGTYLNPAQIKERIAQHKANTVPVEELRTA